MCAAHIEVPNHSDAATLTTASSMRNPAAVSGAACSQSPEWVDITASKRALFRESAAKLIRKSLSYSTRGISHLLCCLDSSPTGELLLLLLLLLLSTIFNLQTTNNKHKT